MILILQAVYLPPLISSNDARLTRKAINQILNCRTFIESLTYCDGFPALVGRILG